MKTIVQVLLITILVSCISCSKRQINTYDCQPLESEVDEASLKIYSELVIKTSVETNNDSLKHAIEKLTLLIETNHSFYEARYQKAEYLCRIGDYDGAVRELKTVFEKDSCRIYTLPLVAFIYEKADEVLSSRDFLNLAIKKFEQKCSSECSEDDFLNLTFLRFYRGDIDAEEALVNLDGVVDPFYISEVYEELFVNFDRNKFLEDVCF